MSRRDAAEVQHEMIEQVHSRLAAEGIVMTYPARRLLLHEDGTGGLERLVAGAKGSRDE